MVTDPHPLRLEIVGEAVGVRLELGVVDDPVAHLQCGVRRRDVDGVFEEVSDVVSHDARLEHVLILG
ncbi:predicted protein [Nocardioides sp. PD653-B2]|nr:predicted protein [Nocardioides sp. PD653-B2]